ncbi:DHA2 family efflux MFS transporter permease subunit [Streptomyces acidicola]|uniref:DHA2 family efflux MFS transporter permease subunit n=1 Tax=Streptomyces acidicola TaxID=2596892 RepID=A0A5N8X4C4_9ACTN|nr:DHA2 family efflux MFS transporter permease subunit [Streptomyces acidicola]MPY53874.1 DHA2 family efflux MFS transporter permease subunit [Streptomyces acidicola]
MTDTTSPSAAASSPSAAGSAPSPAWVPARAWAALAALSLGLFMIVVDVSIVAVAVPAMARALDADLTSVVWVTSAYLLAYVVPMLFTSRLGDRYGPKRVFVAGLVVFTAASLGSGLSGTVGMLIAARTVQGFGAALLTPQTLTLITHLFPGGERGRAMGVLGGVSALAGVTGPLLGGVLVDGLGRQGIFYVNVVVGAAALALSLRVIPDVRPGRAHRFDLLGIVLSGSGLFLVVFGVQNGRTHDWGPLIGPFTVLQTIAAGVFLLAAFLLTQARAGSGHGREPLLPLAVFADRGFAAGTAVTVVLGFAMTGMLLPLIVHLQDALGLSPTAAGLVSAPMALVSGVLAPLTGRLSDRVGGRPLLVAGLLVMALGLALIAVRMAPGVPAVQLVPGLLLTGAGMGLVLVPVNTVAMGTVPAEQRAAASGIFFTGRQLGSVLGSAATGVLLQARISVRVADEARTAAGYLPARHRPGFLASLRDAAESGRTGGAPPRLLPDGLPARLLPQAQDLASQALHAGLARAAADTLLMTAAVLLVGLPAAFAVRATRSRPAEDPHSHTTKDPRSRTAKDPRSRTAKD